MTVPSRVFLRRLRRQPPAPDLIEKLRAGFPDLGRERQPLELCIEGHGFPHDLECGGFVLGSAALSTLAGLEMAAVEAVLGRMKLRPIELVGGELTGLAPQSAIIAVFASAQSVRHFALGYLDESGNLELDWFSKFGRGYPVLVHTIEEINHGAYGEVAARFVCDPFRCGIPEWSRMRSDF